MKTDADGIDDIEEVAVKRCPEMDYHRYCVKYKDLCEYVDDCDLVLKHKEAKDERVE